MKSQVIIRIDPEVKKQLQIKAIQNNTSVQELLERYVLSYIGKEAASVTQSQHYESVGDNLTGDQATRAYRAAQNHLRANSATYLDDVKRLQAKIIKSLEQSLLAQIRKDEKNV